MLIKFLFHILMLIIFDIRCVGKVEKQVITVFTDARTDVDSKVATWTIISIRAIYKVWLWVILGGNNERGKG